MPVLQENDDEKKDYHSRKGSPSCVNNTTTHTFGGHFASAQTKRGPNGRQTIPQINVEGAF